MKQLDNQECWLKGRKRGRDPVGSFININFICVFNCIKILINETDLIGHIDECIQTLHFNFILPFFKKVNPL